MDTSRSSHRQHQAESLAQATAIRAHKLRFTGHGGEYFRVWIVNVLLSVVTLGFYTPWARRRTAQYFYSHSMIASSALEFTAQQRRMVMGFVLVFLLSLAYQIAARTGQDTAVLLFIAGGALLAPYIWASAMRFRLSNTRWRGLRLIFTANWKEIYKASWPVFAMALVWIVVFFASDASLPERDDKGRLPQIPATVFAAIGLGLLLTVLCFIRLEYNYRSLLVLRTRVGNEVSRWKPVYADFVKIWLGTVAVFLLSITLLSLLALGLFTSIMALTTLTTMGGAQYIFMIVVGILAGLLFLVLASTPARAYREARMFHLIWNNTGISSIARFKSTLSTKSYVLLRIKNVFLSLLTLGFYRPFARVSEYRMKFDSVTLYVKGGVDQLTGQLMRAQQEGIGDALADAAGLDLIG